MRRPCEGESTYTLYVQFNTVIHVVFAARCYASATYGVRRCSSVCPSVCVSATFLYSVEMSKHRPIFNFFHHWVATPITIHFFPYHALWRCSDGDLTSKPFSSLFTRLAHAARLVFLYKKRALLLLLLLSPNGSVECMSGRQAIRTNSWLSIDDWWSANNNCEENRIYLYAAVNLRPK